MDRESLSLRTIAWQKTYKSYHANLVKEFFIPALENSILYRRVAGYFSSSVLTIAAAGIAHLIANGGSMELIVGVDLHPADVQAMNQGNMTIDSYIESQIPASLDDLDDLTRFITEERFKALHWLVSTRKMTIKVAIVLDDNDQISPEQEIRLFHDKWGIFYDSNGEYIGFMGSANESKQAWLSNHEKIKVFRGWESERDFLDDDLQDFDSYWHDEEPGIRVYDVSEAVEKKLIRYRTLKPPTQDPVEIERKMQDIRNKMEGVGREGETGAIVGNHFGLQFMNPSDFKCAIQGQVLAALPKIDHSWNALLNTITIEPMEHQTYIAHELFKHFPRGYLLCDEVGLGKTIEAGLAIKWLFLAGKVQRVLIIVPKNLLKQWQEELREKFNLEFLIYDGQDLVSYWDEYFVPNKSNPYNSTDLILVSSGLVRKTSRAEELIAGNNWDLIIFDEAHHCRRKPPRSKGSIGQSGKLLDLAQGLKLKTRAIYLLTATPIQLRVEELFDLLQLLGLGGMWGVRENFQRYYEILSLPESERSDVDWQFLAEMAIDFLKVGRANKTMYETELRELEERPTHFRDLERLFINEDDLQPYLEEHKNDTAFLTELSHELEILSPLRCYMFRNTRKQLQQYGFHVPQRKPDDVRISMNREERALYRQIEQYITEIYNNAEEEQKTTIGFTLAVYRRRLTSSLSAIQKTLEKRKKGLERIYKSKGSRIAENESLPLGIEDEDFDEDFIEDEILQRSRTKGDKTSPEDSDEEANEIFSSSQEKSPKVVLAKESFDAEIEYLAQFIDTISHYLATQEDTKFEELKKKLTTANHEDSKRVLVFTQYTDTLDYLKERLRHNPEFQELGSFSGAGGEFLKRDEADESFKWEKCSKEDIKNWFFEESTFKIMLCTDAASEGLNLHVCSWLINYDLPWNPMRVEQRIGRIDRVKQLADELHIFNLLYTDTIEGRIYLKLWERIRIFYNVVGPLQPILDVYKKAQDFALSEGDDKLSEDQIEKMLGNLQEDMARAQVRHEFFLRLLSQRIKPEVEQSQAMPLFATGERYLSWLKDLLTSSFSSYSKNFPIPNAFSNTDSPNYLSLQLHDGSFGMQLFYPHSAGLIQKPSQKGQSRNFLSPSFTFNLTTDRNSFESLDAAYFFTPNALIHAKILALFNAWCKKNTPTIFARKYSDTQKIPMMEIYIVVEFQNYPLEWRAELRRLTFDISAGKITNSHILANYNEFTPFFNTNSNETKDAHTLDSHLGLLNKIVPSLKKVVFDYMRAESPESSKEVGNGDKLMNWEEIDHDFQAYHASQQAHFLREIQKWLILAHLSGAYVETWDAMPEMLRLGEYLVEFFSSDEDDVLTNLVASFNLESELQTINKSNPLVKELFDTYKNKKKFKLLKADQEQIRLRILASYEQWRKEMQTHKNFQQEYNKSIKLSRPHISILGILLRNED